MVSFSYRTENAQLQSLKEDPQILYKASTPSQEGEKPKGFSQAAPKSLDRPPNGSSSQTLRLGSARVFYDKKVKRVTLQRFLAGRIAFEVEEVSFKEILAFYDNLLWVEQLILRDPNFAKKFGETISGLSNLSKQFRFTESGYRSTLGKMSKELRETLEHFLIPKRNMRQASIRCSGSFHVLPSKSPGTPKSQLKQQRRIGVGYKDSGNRRDEAYDGSPSWQDVAMRSRI